MDPTASAIITFLGTMLIAAVLVAGVAVAVAWANAENLRRYLATAADDDYELARYAHRAAERLTQLAQAEHLRDLATSDQAVA